MLFVPFLCSNGQRPADDESVLNYLDRTIAWYRDIAATEGIAARQREALLADDLRESCKNREQAASLHHGGGRDRVAHQQPEGAGADRRQDHRPDADRADEARPKVALWQLARSVGGWSDGCHENVFGLF